MTDEEKSESVRVIEKSVRVSEKRAIKSTPFVVLYIFLERYATSGILVILPLFLHKKLGFDENLSTSFYHIYQGTQFLFTIVGAVFADTWFGLHKTIVIFSFVYIFGIGILSIGMIEILHLPLEAFIFTGLVLNMISCGCIKGNTPTFGANQHKLPQQEKQLQLFFSAQYFGLKCGSLLARGSFPMIRADVKCFGSEDCYSLAFGISCLVLLISTLIFLAGNSHYTHVKPNGNMLVKVFKCITHAIKEKRRDTNDSHTNQHWLSYSTKKYGRKLVYETKITLKVLTIFIPLILFWSLFWQHSSKWILQAQQMNRDLGFYTIKPDQMTVFNSLSSIVLIPLCVRYFYPLLEKIGLNSMLHRLIVGKVCGMIAFVCAATVQSQIENNYISVLWQLPQFIFISLAEVIIYVAQLNFAYKEAPHSMRPVMMSSVYLTMFFGDYFTAIISGISMFGSQTYEYLFFLFIMFLSAIVLSILSSRYEYTDHEIMKEMNEEEEINETLPLK